MTPGAEGSVVSGLRFYAANDEPGRDPSNYALFGTTNNGADYFLISSGAIGLPDSRNTAGIALNPLRQSVRQVMFANRTPYRSYRLDFTTIKNAAASMVQIGEVELLGVPTPVLLVESRSGDGVLTLRSLYPGRLWSTTVLRDEATEWTDEGAISGTLTLPLTPGTPNKFYRVSAP
jgi:hypothetical protein